MITNTKIVLLGGGYVTIWAYRVLVKKLRSEISRGEASITVVCPVDHHCFHGWTAESLTGIVQEQHRMSPLEALLPKANLVKGKAEEILHKDNLVRITTETGATDFIAYDHLLIGTGSNDSELIEGIGKHGYQIKSAGAFQRTRDQIRSIVQRASQLSKAQAEKILQFTICGGGFLGIELATNLAEYLPVLMEEHASLVGVKPAIRLVTSKDTLLDSLDPGLKKMKRYAEELLLEYRIEVIKNKMVLSVNPEGAILDDHTCIQSSMVISAIGQSRVTLKGTERMKRDELNRLSTDSFLQIPGFQNIWGGGDACAVPHYKKRVSCISNALWAMKHGEYAANNIVRAIRGQQLKSFTYKGLGQCASLGIGKGIGELFGIEFTGWMAWLMRWIVFNYFMPSKKVMLGGIGDWMYLLFVGRRKGLEGLRSASISSSRQGVLVIDHASRV